MVSDKEKSAPLLPTADQVPEALKPSGWIRWEKVPKPNNPGKFNKEPRSPIDGSAIGATFNWPSTEEEWKDASPALKKWAADHPGEKYSDHFLSFEKAILSQHPFNGVGRMVGDTLPGSKKVIVGFDIDDGINPETGQIKKAVATLVPYFSSLTYCEVSPSGTGLHFIGEADVPGQLSATPLDGGEGAKVEIYPENRFFTFTGQRLEGAAMKIGDVQTGVNKLLLPLYGSRASGPASSAERRAMSVLTFRRIYTENDNKLLHAIQGEGNNLLYLCALFAGRGFAGGALEGTEESIKNKFIDIVTKQWKDPMAIGEARGTIESGWRTGIADPLAIIEDKFPELTKLIEDFNERFYVVRNLGGKCLVCDEENPSVKKGSSSVLNYQTFEEFKKGFLHQRVQVGVKEDGAAKLTSRGDAWLHHVNRRQYEKVVFLPGERTASDVLNLWRGFSVEPKRGDCKLYLAHLFDNICQKEANKYRYLISWMAYAVRNPGSQGQVAIVVRGKKGIGKNVFAEAFLSLWSPHGILVGDEHSVTGNFNAHLRDKCVLVCDEAFFAGSKKQAEILKGLITNETINIEAKFVNKVTVPNLLHIIIISNSEHVIRATGDERRFFVVECGDEHMKDYKYFAAIKDQLDNGGRAALLHHLLHEVDLSDFNVREAVHTDEEREQMAASTDGIVGLWQECLKQGVIPGKDHGNFILVRAENLLSYAASLRNRNFQDLRTHHVEQLFGKKGMDFLNKPVRENNQAIRYWHIPPLATCRERWNKKQFIMKWENMEDVWKLEFDYEAPF
jgi:hypothetical protein